MHLVVGVFDFISLIIIAIVLCIFSFFYNNFWKIKDIPPAQKIVFGVLFFSLSITYFYGIFFQFIVNFAFTFVLFLFIGGQILLVMISEISGAETVEKLRLGRIILYLFGFSSGILGPILAYLLVTSLIMNARFSVNWNGLSLIIFGVILFIFSLWGIANEEKYKLHDTKGQMKLYALTFANIILCVFSFVTTVFGVFFLGDLIFRFSPLNMNLLAGVSYLPIGVYLLILSTRKMIEYRKQLNKKLKMVKLV